MYYVGQSIQMNRRFVYHRKTLKSGRHDNDRLQKAYNKYGAEALTMEVLEECGADRIDAAEQWWLDEMFGHRRVLNIAPNATAPNRGRKFGQETRMRVSAASRGRVKSEAERAVMSERQRGRTLDEKTRAKISETKAARAGLYVKRIGSLHHASKPVEGVHVETGKIVRFESARQAKTEGFDQSAVSKVCRNTTMIYKGYRWKFATDSSANTTGSLLPS